MTVDFVGWLRAHNEQSRSAPVLFHGMDLYSLYGSIDAVLVYLDRHDPEAAARARRRYGCLETRDQDTQSYGHAARPGLSRSCEDEVLEQLLEIQKLASGSLDPELFSVEQNARLARNSEAYYRSMFGSQISSAGAWNLRDRHMSETLEAISDHLMRRDGYARVVVWAHNAHPGDARATQMGWEGELNVGQLTREKHGDQAVLVGFTTHDGTVTAASDWGAPAQRMRVQPALPESLERWSRRRLIPRRYSSTS